MLIRPLALQLRLLEPRLELLQQQLLLPLPQEPLRPLPQLESLLQPLVLQLLELRLTESQMVPLQQELLSPWRQAHLQPVPSSRP